MLNFLKILPNGRRKMITRRGARTEPWGTPGVTGKGWDRKEGS